MRKTSYMLLLMVLFAVPAQLSAQQEVKDSLTVRKQEKTSFFSSPWRWLKRNWAAYDPHYAVPSFYYWEGSLQSDLSEEWLNMRYNGGMEVNMRSPISAKIGPYLRYTYFDYGYSFDLNAKAGSNQRIETELAINSNLMSIGFVYRRTGGDFNISKLMVGAVDTQSQSVVQKDVTDMAEGYNIGDRIKYDVTGFNVDFFTNHRKYSNPAASSNSAVQLRSAGSPILGFGYTRQKITNSVGELIEGNVIQSAFQQVYQLDGGATMNSMVQQLNQVLTARGWLNAENPLQNTSDLVSYMNELRSNGETDKFKSILGGILSQSQIQPIIFGQKDGDVLKNTGMLSMIINQIPTTMTVSDWHLRLGYAYNKAFSRRLMLGVSLIAAPGLKRVKMDNAGTVTNIAAEEFANAINSYYGTQSATPEYFRMNVSRTQFGSNFSGRASLVFNYNRWRAGIIANANALLYHSDDANVTSIYGSATIAVGYSFGRKKQFRVNGERRQEYVMAALRKRDIEALHDTLPEGNIGRSESKKTISYIPDRLDLGIYGCDLVKGPDGNYGTYEIQDGYVTPGQDPKNKLAPGTILPMSSDGSLKISCGHDRSIRTANWWRSQLKLRQIPTNWYPELLHYALRGKLTFWVRSYRLGTTKPVKVVIEDFCISHGKETKSFFQIASKNFWSHSAFSIIGNVPVNGRLVRLYIESKHNGKDNYINVDPLKASYLDWMKQIPNERPVSRVSIPGTHDAGTASLPESRLTSTGHTQNLTISEQLVDGIRAFDIRLKKNMNFGHTFECRDGLPETLDSIRLFLSKHPSEFMVAMIGSDEGGEWSEEMKQNFNKLLDKYADLFVQDFTPRTTVGEIRGKILAIKRQEACPYGKLLKFQDNVIFEDNGFCVEDVYKEHKTYRKIKLVEKHIRDAHECLDPDKWYITFNSIAWDPRHHKPYYSAWGAVNVRKPMNPSLRSVIEDKSYTNFGIVFLDFYNDHCDHPQLVESIIKSNFSTELEKDYIPAGNETAEKK